jgi:7,8-dihydropterin-6-yl-methyl-4-(beta-D-ribofuranosyl)aminobenzene 5'-phosphate synthase
MILFKNLCYATILFIFFSLILHADDIHIAAARGDLELVKSSLEKNQELLDAKDNEGNTLLHVACINGKQNVVEFLISQNVDVNEKNNMGNPTLHFAALGGSADIVEILLENGSEINARDNRGFSAIRFAVFRGFKDIVSLLADKGADVHEQNMEWGGSLLHTACLSNRIDLVDTLIAKGVDIQVTNSEGLTPLHLASNHGQNELCELLIAKGADVNLIDNGKDTPLHGAAWYGKMSTVELFLANSAQINPRNDKGRTPFDNAIKRGHEEVAVLLQAKGAEKGMSVNEVTGISGKIDKVKEGLKQPVKFTILYDNYLHREGTKTDWGFSCLIEGTEKTILFDTGTQPEILLHNVHEMNVDLKKVEQIVITHDHGDHTGGLSEVLKINPNVSVYLPASFPYEFVRKVEMLKAQVDSVDEPVEICENVFLTGEMMGHAKEQSLIINTQKGLVIVTGCSHQGIVNVLKRAKEIMDRPIYLVFGGFHLGGTPDRTLQKIIQSFEELGVEKCGATHCTGDKAIDMFKEAFGDNYLPMGTGNVIVVD